MITALCGQAGGITKSGKPCRIRVSDSGRLCMAHDPQHRKNGLLAEDGDRNVTQTITDGIIKGIGDGIHQLDLNKLITAGFNDDQWLIEPVIPAHRLTALYAAGKTGKSLLVLNFDQARLL